MTPCPSCGHANPKRARFCAECGMALVPAAEAPATREVRKTVTVLFADVAGSTSLGEQLDPETLRALLGRHFAVMKRIIELHGGTVEKFIGDAVMAVFGIPLLHEDDALRAVRAAGDIRIELAALDAELEASRGLAIRFRTGINTGEVVAGDPTGGQGFVTGDTVNTAARLEEAAQPGEILLGGLTWQLVRDAVSVEPVEPIVAKGKHEPVAAYRLLAVDPALAGHIRRLDTPLIGRERELATLRNAFDRVASERSCQLFTLLGSAGVGKSRLVAEFTASIAAEATILHGRCLSYGEGITYWPIGEIVRAAAGIDEADTAEIARTKLRAMFAGQRDADVLTARVASAIGRSAEAAPQEEVFWAVRKLFEQLAQMRPLVVVIEDIHWAEPTLLDLIEHIADLSREASILLLCPARSELLDARPGWGGGKLNATTVLLEPLGAEATARLIAALPGGEALPADVETRIATATEGNPLFVEEVLGMLVDDGMLARVADGPWRAVDELGEVRIPASITALLEARLERLAPNERDVAERASVVGRVFEQAAVTELTDEALRPGVGRSLLALVRKELIRPERSDVSAGDAFRFRHSLIRDAAYEALPKSERAFLHERFADLLERRSATDPGDYHLILGYHLEQAYRYRVELGDDPADARLLADRALTCIGPAGQAALERGDPRAAASLLRRAVNLCPPGRQRIELLMDLRSALLGAGERAASDAADAETLALLAEYPDEGLEHRRRMWESVFLSGGSITEAQDAYAYYERVGDAMGMAGALEVAAGAHANSGRFSVAMELLDQAIALVLEAGRPDRAANLYADAALWLDDSPVPIPEALDRCRRYLDLAGGNRRTRAGILLAMGELESRSRVPRRWRRHFDAAKAIIDDLGLTLLGAWLYPITLGEAELASGEPARTVDLLRQSCATLDRLGHRGVLASLAPRTAQTLLALGRLDEVEHYAFWGRDVADPLDVEAQMGWRVAISGLRSLQGRHDEAVTLARESVALVAGSEWLRSLAQSHLALARALRGAGDEPAARAAAHEAESLAAARQDVASLRTIAAFLRG